MRTGVMCPNGIICQLLNRYRTDTAESNAFRSNANAFRSNANVFLRSAIDILLTDLITTINKKIINNNSLISILTLTVSFHLYLYYKRGTFIFAPQRLPFYKALGVAAYTY